MTDLTVEPAQAADVPGMLALAGEVEHWFGPMVEEPGFHRALDEHIADQRALIAYDAIAGRTQPLGAVLFGGESPRYAVHWLVVSERARGRGVGRRLMTDVVARLTDGRGLAAGEVVEVVTFGEDHPGAVASGARVFYERLGFTPAEPAPNGPEGGSRQVFRYQR
ncbi:GNAT family N-acetyltransferase [Kribbella sp. HUAS MG21]|jgi:GNAT superfamily N-acetyltransferase|uniref:GNAT family N-acetyltransferase n=1 Tax=Kribbella sp. HUAS MG21 TaxID=3160966 RepID=A0AAU7T6Y5_9ACTN